VLVQKDTLGGEWNKVEHLNLDPAKQREENLNGLGLGFKKNFIYTKAL